MPVSFVANFGGNQDLFGQIRSKPPFLGIYRLHDVAVFLGPRGPLVEPSILHPSVRPPATIFPEFIDEL